MEQLTLLFSPEGACLLPDGEEFLAALGDPNPDYDAVGFAVRNLGFIKFQVLDRLVTEIELHPRNVDRSVLSAVERHLRKPGTKLFRIKYLESEWRSEISASAEHTIARLHELCAAAFGPPPSENFSAELKDYETLARHAAMPLRMMAQKWRTSFGSFDSSVLSFAIDRHLLSRIMIAEIMPRSLDPVFRFIGDGLTALGNSYPFEGIGRPLVNIPDKDYGAWVAEFYKSVAVTGQPRYDVVTATIQNPGSAGKARPISYERLLLPWRTPSDEVLVSLVSNRVSETSEREFAMLLGTDPAARKLVKSS